MKVLIAEDDPVSAKVLEHTLTKSGYSVTVARDGQAAFEALKRQTFDALLTDWMMPHMDGIELIHAVRAHITPVPLIVIITALASPEAKAHALSSGADEYFGKPVIPREVVHSLGSALSRRSQPALRITRKTMPVAKQIASEAPYVAVVVAASTGGPPALSSLLAAIPHTDKAAFFVVQHGPAWMLESFVEQLGKVTNMKVRLASDGMVPLPGEIYIAPGERNLVIEPKTYRLRVVDTPAENFVRPAADPLFRSAAAAFGTRCVAVVMTGMGRDGAAGAAAVDEAGGTVVFQDPETAVARSMPQSVANLNLTAESMAPAKLPGAIMRHVSRLSVLTRLILQKH